MIARLSGTLAEREADTIVIQTDGGLGYVVTIPLGVYERLPQAGARITLFTELVVREDGWSLFGFDRPVERTVFQRLLGASGFGPKLALAVLSALGPERAVLSIQNRDIAALSTVSGIGKKKAERLVVELHDRFKDMLVETSIPRPQTGDEASRALVALGYPATVADEAVRAVIAEGTEVDTPQLIRRALQRLGTRRGGS